MYTGALLLLASFVLMISVAMSAMVGFSRVNDVHHLSDLAY